MKLDDKFNKPEFVDWIEAFLPEFSIDIRKVDVAAGFTGIKSIETLGESNINVRVFIIETDRDPSGRKVGLAKESFTLIKNYGTPNALIAYHSQETKQWRLSLLTSSPIWSEGKIITKLSNPKRQSYVLGPHSKVNTPHKFLLKNGAVQDIQDLKARFSLEVVNKEFYQEISECFTKLVGGTLGTGRSKKRYEPQLELPSNNKHDHIGLEFAVRLIGRIIFCWFLREKKNDDDVSLMPKDLLSLEAATTTADYYHKVLEPIFFEVLNQPIRLRKDPYYDKPYSLIPYLNGGLFSPHDDDFYKRRNGDPESQFHDKLVVPDKWFDELFKTLETYNFTIDENTSFDEELSIDPEMLGRIFENLLAEINPDTGESARKSTGSYYTPRAIVDYMVDESLLMYLKQKTNIDEQKLRAAISYDLTDDTQYPLNKAEKEKMINAIGGIKILDPACGSGAFPIGVLQKIVFTLQQIDPNGQLWLKEQLKNTPPELRRKLERENDKKNYDYIRKLGVISESIYGVDIQPIATEISRLRCFLTLIVDQNVIDAEENRGIEPLPNLDFKFLTANSLVSLPESEGLFAQYEDIEGIEQLKFIRKEYFGSSGIERAELVSDFYKTQKEIGLQLEKNGGQNYAEMSNALRKWDPFSHRITGWFDSEWMYGIKEGFDIVIANPPYVGEKGHKEMFDHLRQTPLGKRFHKGKMDLFYFFFHLGLDNLRDGGILTFISTNYYPTADGAIKLRRDMYERSNVLELINFNEYKIFESALGQHNMITLLQKGQPDPEFITFQTFVETKGGPDATELADILNRNSKYGIYNRIPRSNLFDGKNLYLRFATGSPEIENILIKMLDRGTPLKEFATTNEGLHTGLDTISDKELRKLSNVGLVKGEGVFVLPKGEFKFKHLRPWFKGSDIGHYVANTNSTLEVLYYENNIVPDDDELEHLSKYKRLLVDRVAIKRANRPWYQLNWPRQQSMFEGQKIVNPYRSQKNYFALVDDPWYASADVFFTQTKNSALISNEVLTAILNSKLILFWLIYRGKRKGNILEIKSIPIGQIPIIIPSQEQKNKLEVLVNEIIATKIENNSADISEKEFEINKIIYQMYKLTKDEINFIESSKLE